MQPPPWESSVRFSGEQEAAGIIEPGATRWIGDLIEALVLTDELDEATELTDRLEERALTLERASAVAHRPSAPEACLATARGDLDEALAAIEAAAQSQERVPVPFDRARTLLALGSVRRRAGRKRQARDALEAARGAFAELGATIWIERARDLELGRIGGRPSSGGELTRSEQRVAALVAEGHTNREVAAALFLSERTVESHLSHVYSASSACAHEPSLQQSSVIPPFRESRRAPSVALCDS